MGPLLFLLFVAVPIGELALLIKIGDILGLPMTVAIVIVTGMVGASLARWQGLLVMRKLRTELNAGRMPAGPMFEGVLLLIAGAFLITPGVITDVVGFLLLIPPFRWLVAAILKKWATGKINVIQTQAQTQAPGEAQPPNQPRIIEAEEYVVRSEKPEE